MSGHRLVRNILVAASVLAIAPAAWGQAWWQLAWPHRRAVDVEGYKPTRLKEGTDLAVVTMPTGGFVKPDGSDVRVTTTGRTEVPCRVLMVGPGDQMRVAFAVLPTSTRYYVYFGHPAPPPQKAPLEIHRGVLLETWEYPGGGIKTLDEVQRVFTRVKTLLGRDFRDRIFLGHNPFGPQNRIASRFTAYVDCKTGGQYQFACSSQDASFLLVDDKLVVANGGHHPPQSDVSMKGAAELKEGLHKLTFYHVNDTADPVATVAWQAPGEQRIWTIPAGAFAPVFQATPGPMEQYGKSVGIDFLPHYGGETFMENRYYQRWSFQALRVGQAARSADLTWDFGDGQRAAAPTVEHIYLLPGEYSVTLTTKVAGNELTRTNRIFVSRPWDKVTDNRLDSLARHAQLVAEYDFAALSPEANAEAILLLDRAKATQAVAQAGAAFVKRDKAPAPLIEEVMPVYARAVEPPQAVAGFLKAAELTKNPATRAAMFSQAGRIYLDRLQDAEEAAKLFQRVVSQLGPLTTAAPIRDAKIGLGDVWRLKGDYEQARKAYAAAGLGASVNPARMAITKGDYARHVEDYIRKADPALARESLDQWQSDIPADKLEGFWSLLVVRLCLTQNDHAGAVREAGILVKVNPASNYAAELLLLSAESYRKLGQPDKARAALRQIVEKYPESPLARDAATILKE